MPQETYEKFCTLDDSSMFLPMEEMPEMRCMLHFYASSLCLESGDIKRLVIVKPASDTVNAYAADSLKEFLLENIEGKLIACKHYDSYYHEMFEKEFDVEFIHRRTKKEFSEEVQRRFAKSDKDAYKMSREAKRIFTQGDYIKHRKMLLEAVVNGKEYLGLGHGMHLRGLHIV